MLKGLQYHDSELIGFVEDCLMGPITIKEMHQWVQLMIEKYDDLPTYFYYLDEVNDISEFRECVGFLATYDATYDELKALSGIAYLRDPDLEDGVYNISKRAALNALKRNPQVVKRFHETFPFIELNDDLKALLAQAESKAD